MSKRKWRTKKVGKLGTYVPRCFLRWNKRARGARTIRTKQILVNMQMTGDNPDLWRPRWITRRIKFVFSSARLVSWLGPLSASPRFGSARLRGRPSCLAPLSFLCILLARPEEEGRRRCARHSGHRKKPGGKRTGGRRKKEYKVKLKQRTRRRRGFPLSTGDVCRYGEPCRMQRGRAWKIGRDVVEGRKMDVLDPQIPQPRAQPPPVFLIFASRSSRTLETQGAAAIMPGCTTIPAGLLSFPLSPAPTSIRSSLLSLPPI